MIIALAPLFLWPTSLAAQTPTTPASSAPSTKDIVVTARRRPEVLAQVAAPVSAVTREELRDSLSTKVDDLDQLFPALTVQPTGTGNLVFIRGVGNFTLQPNSDPAVGFAYDGVMIARPSGTMGPLYDIDRVELIKGPQGVLYGRSAAAGSINVEPRQPILGHTDAGAELTVGSYAQRRVEAAANFALGESAAVRLSGVLTRRDPYLRGYAEGDAQESLRGQLKIALGPRLSVRLSGDYSHLGGAGIGSSYAGRYVYLAAERRYRFIPSGLSLSQGIYSAPAQSFRQTIFLPGAGRNLDPIASVPRQDVRLYGAHSRLEADLGIATLVLLPAWRGVSLDSIIAGSPFGYHIVERDEQRSLEARLSGRRGIVEWLGGGLLFDETIDSSNATNLSSSLILSKQKYDTHSSSVFGNTLLHLASTLRASAGIRWTRDRKRFAGGSDTLTIICLRRVSAVPACPTAPLFPLVLDFGDQPLPVPGQPGRVLPIFVQGNDTGAIIARSTSAGEGRLAKGYVDWRVGAEFDLTPRSMAYANVETGHRPGGFNIATGFETFAPERLTAFTLGLRHGALNGRVRLDAEAFWWFYRNQQVSALRPDLSTPPRNANITDNIADSRLRGVEFEARLEPWSQSQVRAVVQFLDAGYRSFRFLQANTGVPPLTGCEPSLVSPSLYAVDCSKQQPYNSPRWSLFLAGRQSFAAGPLLATIHVDTQFRSARNIGFAFLPEQRIGAGWTSNFAGAIGRRDGKWDLTAFVQNLEGRRIPEFMIYHPISNALVAGTGAPRRFGLRLDWHY